MMKKIWSNFDLNFDNWRDDLKEHFPDYSEEKLYEVMVEINDSYLEDERANLNIKMPSPILIIADIGRWNGRCSGYKVIESGNISDCLYFDTELAKFYLDELGDLRCNAIHHDGTNYLLFRTFKESATETQIENLKEKIFFGTATRQDITRVTNRLGDYIAPVYGWKIKGGIRNVCRV